MVHRLSRLLRRDDGAVAILTVVLTSLVFIGLCALVIDLGLARDTRRQAQNAADASALAAGNVLYMNMSGTAVNISGAISATKDYALRNYKVPLAAWTACSDASALTYHYPGDTNCISFDNDTRPTAVRVKVPTRDVSTPFAGIWGVTRVPVSAVAQIQLAPGGRAQCGLCITGRGPHNLQNGEINVSGANIAINGTLDANPQASIIDIAGGVINLEGSTPNQGTYDPAPLQHQPPIPDPLINMTMPDFSGLAYHATRNSCPGVPGIYDQLIACSSGTGMTPGLYVLTGQTEMHGNEVIVANGVTLYFLCGTPALPRPCLAPGLGGSLLMTGNAILTITAPSAGQANAGLAIVADRNNTATFSFRGNGAQTNSGTIYAASGTLDIRGNGAANNLNSLVVVKDFSFSGSNAALTSAYAQSANVAIDSGDLHLSE
jgi:Flp pilus assembly protein TadG